MHNQKFTVFGTIYWQAIKELNWLQMIYSDKMGKHILYATLKVSQSSYTSLLCRPHFQ